LARAFTAGGTLVAWGSGAAASDAAHVAVEFMHPVIVGARAPSARRPRAGPSRGHVHIPCAHIRQKTDQPFYVFQHGISTIDNDRIEVFAFEAVEELPDDIQRSRAPPRVLCASRRRRYWQ